MAVTTSPVLVRPLASARGWIEDSRPDRPVRGDEQDLAVRAAEGEVDRPGQPDQADEIPGRAEHLDPAERGRVDVAGLVHLDPVREPRSRDSEQAPRPKVAAVVNLEGDDAVRPPDVIAARFLVGAAVGDVEGVLVGRERQTVGLVETIGDDRQPIGGRVVAVHVVPDLRLGAGTLAGSHSSGR
jgi:hypothetical protein